MGPDEPRGGSTLVSHFWEYAKLVLPLPRLERLEDACRARGGGTRSGRLPAGRGGAEVLCAIVRVAAQHEGKGFVRRAGYYAGSSTARAFVRAAAHPAESAERMAQALAGAVPGATLVATVDPSRGFEVRIEGEGALQASVVEYVTGFVRGGAVRLNEGEPPVIRARPQAGGRVWSAKIEFAGAGGASPTGARRRRPR